MSTPHDKKTPAELMQQYWAACRARGEQPRKVHALVALEGATEPAGRCIAWGVGRGYVLTQLEKRQDPDKWEIQEIEPYEPE